MRKARLEKEHAMRNTCNGIHGTINMARVTWKLIYSIGCPQYVLDLHVLPMKNGTVGTT